MNLVSGIAKTKSRVPSRATGWPPTWMPAASTDLMKDAGTFIQPDSPAETTEAHHISDPPERVPSRAKPEPGLTDLTDPPWTPRRPREVVAEIAAWPIPWRERWGRRSNDLEDAGVAFPESEQQAYRETKAAMERRQSATAPPGSGARHGGHQDPGNDPERMDRW